MGAASGPTTDIPLGPRQPQPEPAFDPDRFERAHLLLQAGRARDAATELLAVLARQPDDGVALRILAICQLELGQWTNAVQTAEAAARQLPDDPWTLLVLSQTLTAVDRHGEGLEAAGNATRLDPSHPVFVRRLALALVMVPQRRHQARAIAGGQLTMAPDDPESHNIAGVVEAELHDIPAARAAYQRALAIDPLHTAARNNLADLEVGIGRLGQASTLLTSTLAIDGPDPDAIRVLTEALAWRARWVALVVIMAGMTLGIMAVDEDEGMSNAPYGTRVTTGLCLVAVSLVFGWFHLRRVRSTLGLGSVADVGHWLVREHRTLAIVLAGAAVTLVAATFLPDAAASVASFADLLLVLPLVPALLAYYDQQLAAAQANSPVRKLQHRMANRSRPADPWT